MKPNWLPAILSEPLSSKRRLSVPSWSGEDDDSDIASGIVDQTCEARPLNDVTWSSRPCGFPLIQSCLPWAPQAARTQPNATDAELEVRLRAEPCLRAWAARRHGAVSPRCRQQPTSGFARADRRPSARGKRRVSGVSA